MMMRLTRNERHSSSLSGIDRKKILNIVKHISNTLTGTVIGYESSILPVTVSISPHFDILSPDSLLKVNSLSKN